ncbi:MAG: restriction endonuclease [Geobacteraceae bacterium]|nr:restriction endonuclease [Geobacteraceae bacterium]
MARRSRNQENIIETLMMLPWWVSLVLMVIGNIFLRFMVPSFYASKVASGGQLAGAVSNGVSGAMPGVANIFTLVMAVTLCVSLIRSYIQSRQIAATPAPFSHEARRQPSCEPALGVTGLGQKINHTISAPTKPSKLSQQLLNDIEWKRFETLCAAAIRELGLDPKETQYGPDGGIDIIVHKTGTDGPVGIVQCKAGEDRVIGVKPVRELLGVMTHGDYKQGMFMTTGGYTQEAIDFAKGKLTLVTGEMLINKINSMPQDKLQRLMNLAFDGDYTTPTCPKCGVKMVLRQASTGRNAGASFWGCMNYPRCRQTLRGKEAVA